MSSVLVLVSNCVVNVDSCVVLVDVGAVLVEPNFDSFSSLRKSSQVARKPEGENDGIVIVVVVVVVEPILFDLVMVIHSPSMSVFSSSVELELSKKPMTLLSDNSRRLFDFESVWRLAAM